MKNISLIDGQWKQRVAPQVTKEERDLLNNRDSGSSEAKKALIERIRNESLIAADPADAETAQALYDQHKINGSELIAADILMPDGTGIINCRVDGEHQQIRF
jgi:hypothetical protein